MKKLLLIIVLVSVTLWLPAIDASASIGLQQKIVYLGNYTYEAPNMFVEIGMSQDIGAITLYRKYRNEFEKAQSIYFNPLQDYYTVGLNVEIVRDITITLEHQCYHPVNPFNQNTDHYNGGYSAVYITVK